MCYTDFLNNNSKAAQVFGDVTQGSTALLMAQYLSGYVFTDMVEAISCIQQAHAFVDPLTITAGATCVDPNNLATGAYNPDAPSNLMAPLTPQAAQDGCTSALSGLGIPTTSPTNQMTASEACAIASANISAISTINVPSQVQSNCQAALTSLVATPSSAATAACNNLPSFTVATTQAQQACITVLTAQDASLTSQTASSACTNALSALDPLISFQQTQQVCTLAVHNLLPNFGTPTDERIATACNTQLILPTITNTAA
ncbi:MAG TPA: hypothetical protein VJJ83_02785, partial [Candidatus Babeliales bacterium]|nr:hypothetical protein [Candidatus Babeliales bacterium]